MNTAMLDRHHPAAPPELAAPETTLRHTGITCTVGGSRVRHVALLMPDPHGTVRLVPACGVGISSREPEGRVLPYLFSAVATCGRGGCLSHPPPESAPRYPQLMLDFDV